MRKRCLLLLLVIPALSFVCLSQQKSEEQQNKGQEQDSVSMGFTKQVDEISKARETAELYVRRVKLKLKPENPDYRKCSDLYDTAFAAYNGWVNSVSLAIKMGNAKNLQRNSDYRKVAIEAKQTEQAFISCARSAISKSETSPQSGNFPLIPAGKPKKNAQSETPGKILDWAKKGIEIWKIVRAAQDDRRKQLATVFEDAVKWKTWEEITPSSL